jgi:hypothetical protein
MDDAEKVRDRATRLFALALQCRETGLSFYADELEQLAREASDHADAIERDTPPTPMRQLDQPVAQQQQQPQVDSDKSE